MAEGSPLLTIPITAPGPAATATAPPLLRWVGLVALLLVEVGLVSWPRWPARPEGALDSAPWVLDAVHQRHNAIRLGLAALAGMALLGGRGLGRRLWQLGTEAQGMAWRLSLLAHLLALVLAGLLVACSF